MEEDSYCIESIDGYMVLVDAIDHAIYSPFTWYNQGSEGRGRWGILYTRVKAKTRNGKNKKSIKPLHRLITGAKKGESVHHKGAIWDLRRSMLKVYPSVEEHLKAEHPELSQKRKGESSAGIIKSLDGADQPHDVVLDW